MPLHLHLFQADLLEDSNLEQSNIIQQGHTLQQLTNDNATFGSILYPIRKYSSSILDTPVTF